MPVCLDADFSGKVISSSIAPEGADGVGDPGDENIPRETNIVDPPSMSMLNNSWQSMSVESGHLPINDLGSPSDFFSTS
jgi:hypothetical protein